MKTILIILLMCTYSFAANLPTGEWVIKTSTLTYEVTHKLKKFKGTSNQARGKASCDKRECQIAFGVPIASFDSGDSSRDLHVFEASKAAVNKLATATAVFGSDFTNLIKVTKMQVSFAGFSKEIKDLEFKVVEKSQTKMVITGLFVLKLTAFGLERPTFLTMAVQDDVPVSIEMIWEKK